MRSGKKTFLHFVVLCFLVSAASSLLSAQALNSNIQSIALNATLNESLTLSLSASSVSFSLTAGNTSNPGSTNITATTRWAAMKPGRTAVTTYAYFGSATTALTDGAGDNIPSSAFFIADNGGTSTALSATVPFATNSGLQLTRVSITGTNRTGSSTDNMAFNIDLSGGTLPQLPAGSYTGTLNIEAQATP